MTFVLDASALLATILDEDGADFVRSVESGSEMSIVNLAEVMTKLAERGGDPADASRYVHGRGIRITKFTEAHALMVAELRPATSHRGLGIGDRTCLAHGRISALPVLTGERKWVGLEVGVDIRLFRHQG